MSLLHHSEITRYENLQQRQEDEWEATCLSCGACCGAFDGDPCEHLIEIHPGKYFCNIYEHRFGTHRTFRGRTLQCVPIRKILRESWPGDHNCAYKKNPTHF